jgi:hypothetical protein
MFKVKENELWTVDCLWAVAYCLSASTNYFFQRM